MGSFENDRAFESVLQNTGNIDRFLDEFFSFLARRTDFFVVSPREGAKIGFPPGIAAKLIVSKFKKWESSRASSSDKSDADKPPSSPNVSCPLQQAQAVTGTGANSEVKMEIEVTTEALAPSASAPLPPSVSASASSAKDKTKSFSSIANNGHNGRVTDKYSWSQTIKDIDLQLPVGPEVKSKGNLLIDIQPTKIFVMTTEYPGGLVDWVLPFPIIKDESFWSLHPGEAIVFSLQKAKEMWWDHLFEGEEPIDRTKLEAVRPMEELGEEEQAKIHELVFNQEQKMKGLPTTDQMKLEKVMKEAWNAEGSPFKGQPFDPTRVQLANNSISPPGSQENN